MDVEVPFVLVELDEIDGEKWRVPIYLHPAYKVEVRAPEPNKKKLMVGVGGAVVMVGVGGAVVVALVVAAVVSLANRPLLNFGGFAGY